METGSFPAVEEDVELLADAGDGVVADVFGAESVWTGVGAGLGGAAAGAAGFGAGAVCAAGAGADFLASCS